MVLLDRTRMAARIAASGEVADRAKGIAIWQLMNFVRAQPAAPGLPITRLLERVRRLVRLADDRDLRQLQACAQGIDAVRLMTIHGAKGLEFPVVHLPGLNAGTIPRSPPTPPCPPPDGMVEGEEGSALEAFRAGQAEEQECLFYVALSRARDRLIAYAPTQTSDGKRRSLSPFVDRLEPWLTQRHVTPTRDLPAAPEDAAISISVKGSLRFDAQKIALYEGCARRFFYTHILQIGGRRTETPFMQMHEAVRKVFQGVVDGSAPVADDAELDRRITEAFVANGLAKHGYAAHYKAFAVSMLQYFLRSRRGHEPETPTTLRVGFGQEEIFVRPDDILVRPDGMRTLRSIRTGHQRSTEGDDVGSAAFLVAAQKAFPGATVELVYLSDQSIQPVVLSEKKLQNRRDKLVGFLRDIRSGRFPADAAGRRCPGCPAFFVCGPTPPGVLTREFS